MSASQMSKLTKDQLIAALRDAPKAPTAEMNRASPQQQSGQSVTISIDAFDMLLKERLDPLTQTLANISRELQDLRTKVRELEQLKAKSDYSEDELTLKITNEVEQRHLRSKNVVISGLQLLSEGPVDRRKIDDERQCKELLAALEIFNFKITATHRIGKQITDRPSLLKVSLGATETKYEILRKSKMLRTSLKYKKVYINPDRTPCEQLQQRKLLQEWKSRKEAGEDVVIFRQNVVARASVKNFQDRS